MFPKGLGGGWGVSPQPFPGCIKDDCLSPQRRVGTRLRAMCNGQGGFKSGCKGGYRRLEQCLGGHVWWVQSGWRAVGGGEKR